LQRPPIPAPEEPARKTVPAFNVAWADLDAAVQAGWIREEAARALSVPSLREIDESALKARQLPSLLERRARHVVREIQRVQMAANALRRVCTAGEANIGTERIRCPA
jgi:hypothetical protein